jgi:hypothetical protein
MLKNTKVYGKYKKSLLYLLLLVVLEEKPARVSWFFNVPVPEVSLANYSPCICCSCNRLQKFQECLELSVLGEMVKGNNRDSIFWLKYMAVRRVIN